MDGPPADWLERVRRGAPHLLDPRWQGMDMSLPPVHPADLVPPAAAPFARAAKEAREAGTAPVPVALVPPPARIRFGRPAVAEPPVAGDRPDQGLGAARRADAAAPSSRREPPPESPLEPPRALPRPQVNPPSRRPARGGRGISFAKARPAPAAPVAAPPTAPPVPRPEVPAAAPPKQPVPVVAQEPQGPVRRESPPGIREASLPVPSPWIPPAPFPAWRQQGPGVDARPAGLERRDPQPGVLPSMPPDRPAVRSGPESAPRFVLPSWPALPPRRREPRDLQPGLDEREHAARLARAQERV